jgi:thiamine phosphate synthase YjbQ (UPF0047 family)
MGEPPAGRVERCFKSAHRSIKQYEAEEELEQDLEPLLELLESETQDKDPAALQSELRARLSKLRLSAAALRARRDSVVSLISQGGLSLGNWQAGFLYLLIEHGSLRSASAARADREELATLTWRVHAHVLVVALSVHQERYQCLVAHVESLPARGSHEHTTPPTGSRHLRRTGARLERRRGKACSTKLRCP